MTTITVWLLIHLGGVYGHNSVSPTTTIERFATVEECQRVSDLIRSAKGWGSPSLMCIQATVIR